MQLSTVIGEAQIENSLSSETMSRAMGGRATARLNPIDATKTMSASLAASLKQGAVSAAEGER